ncbi:MAG: type II toxin-antitoxin system YafQ family toxin [Anaerorhabdus sp.]
MKFTLNKKVKYLVKKTKRFKEEFKKYEKRGYDFNRLNLVVEILSSGDKLSKVYKDHQLKGKWNGCRECHIAPDWLLIYRYYDNDLILELMRTGTHSDLF